MVEKCGPIFSSYTRLLPRSGFEKPPYLALTPPIFTPKFLFSALSSQHAGGFSYHFCCAATFLAILKIMMAKTGYRKGDMGGGAG